MQLPIKSHYATLAMLSLAVRYQSGQLLTARTISDQQRIPSQFLGQILQQLRTAGLIVSVRGSAGGFRLAKPPDQISLAAIVDAVCFSPSFVADFGQTDGGQWNAVAQVVAEVWQELDELQTRFLHSQTLAQLAQRLTPDAVAMFYI
ncbi:MAG: Rrf2 family transcriptional regulator [Pirellulaceae bacterium]|nr:Rrf2 family transcriptional regulator [Pirellulaceae bacterium]